MARDRDSKELPGASSNSGQSKSTRPPLSRTESDNSNTTETSHAHKTKRQHHVGRLHARVPSSKALHNKGHRRAVSPDPAHHHPQRPTAHRRATSEVKLSRESSSTNLSKNASQTSLKKNRSYGDVHKRTKSTEKLKRHSGGTTTPTHRPKSSKSQVHFDLGSDDNEEEGDWVDASGSNSPLMSRKGGVNSSAQSSLRPTASANNSRPETPIDRTAQQGQPSPERSRSLQQQYLTSRLLQRTPSSGAPPQMTSDMAQVHPTKSSYDSTGGQKTPLTGSTGKDGPLTSRFVDGTSGSGGASQGSTIHPSANIDGRRSEEIPRRPKSMADLSRTDQAQLSGNKSPRLPDDRNDSALVPKPQRRTGLPAEASRIQQKLNLQRESSDVKTGPSGPVNGGMTTPLIGVNGPGYDGANSRDPRVAKLVERAESEYLVVRRYQNPIARSLNRLKHNPELEKALRIPTKGGMTGSIASRRSQHARNISTPAASRPVTPRAQTGSFEGDGDNTRLSGSSLVGSQEDDGVQALLRQMWEKPMDLSASAD